MTDRIYSLSVALEDNVRADDVVAIIDAIVMIKGVLDVQRNVADASQWVADCRARYELASKLWGILYPQSIRKG